MTVGEEAVMADPVEAVRKGMQQEAPDEFVRCQRYYLALVVMPIIAPTEANPPVRERDQAGV